MKEPLISLETAKLAKEKGFNNGCMNVIYTDGEIVKAANFNQANEDGEYSAPTQSLLQKWLREEKKINLEVMRKYDGHPSKERDWFCREEGSDFTYPHSTYEEALEAGLINALKSLKK